MVVSLKSRDESTALDGSSLIKVTMPALINAVVS